METMRMSGGATIRAPDRDLRPVAIRPIVGNMSTSRNQGLALLMLFKETMKEGRGEEAAFSMEEMALSQKNTSKAYWVIKLTPKNVETMEALMPNGEEGVHQMDLGDVIMPDRAAEASKGTPLKIEWTWWDSTSTQAGVGELTGAGDLGDFHANELVLSGLVTKTYGVNLDDAAAGQVAEKLLMGYGGKQGEGLEAAAQKSGYTLTFVLRDMSRAGTEAKNESEEQDPKALRPARLPGAEAMEGATKGMRFNLRARPTEQMDEEDKEKYRPIALPMRLPFCNGETLKQVGEEVSWEPMELEIKEYTVQGREEMGWKAYDAVGKDGRGYTVFAPSEEAAMGVPSVEGMKEKPAEDEEAGKQRNYDRGGKRMSERLVKEADRNMKNKMGVGLCDKS